MTRFSVDDFFKNHADDLALAWLAGRTGSYRALLLKMDQKLANIGYFNLIHPHQIQIIGSDELTYFEGITKKTFIDTLKQLFEKDNLVCIIVVDALSVPQELTKFADDYQIPLLTSSQSGEEVINYLHTTLARLLAQRTTMHGVFMDVLGMGVLIMGDSGTGKSELALELVSRGHRLVADDAPEFSLMELQVIRGTCILDMNAFLEVRGLGVLNVQALFGDSAIKKSQDLSLIVQLEHATPERLQNIDRLQGDYRVRQILGVEIPEMGLPVAPGRNLAVLLECAVRNYSLRQHGYNAADDFCEQQRQALCQSED
jgi:HPr kinase/phosphorylase